MIPSDSYLVFWADNLYKDWLQDPRTQSAVWGRHGTCYIHTLNSRIRVPHSVTHGTIRITDSDPEEPAGHWCAFAKLPQTEYRLYPTVLVYDPSGVDGEYAAPDQDEFKRDIGRGFPGFRVQLYKPRFPPQNNDYDTWCNSWSLAWLHSDLQAKVTYAEQIEAVPRRIDVMRQIIDHFTSNEACPDYIRDPWRRNVRPYFDRFYEDGYKMTRTQLLPSLIQAQEM